MSEQRVTLPGQRLRSEREARGMTGEDVARQLNLTVSYLNALEADDYERLPEATFIRGYIRNYARLLGLPSDDLVHTFDEVMEEEAGETAGGSAQDVARPQRRRSGFLGLMALAVLVLAGVVYLLLDESGNPAPATGSETVVPRSSPEVVAEPEPLAEEGAELEPGGLVDGQTGQQQAGGPADMAEAAPADRLIVSFNEGCWVEVSNEAGETLFAGQKQADERLSLEAAGPFRIKFGNAAAVSLITVNGNVVSMPSSAPGDVVRLTVP